MIDVLVCLNVEKICGSVLSLMLMLLFFMVMVMVEGDGF